MADIKTKYPASSADTSAITHALASLADDNTNKLAGAQTDVVNNTSNLDLDHIVSGVIKAGTSPTSGRTIEVWAFAPYKIASGTATYPAHGRCNYWPQLLHSPDQHCLAVWWQFAAVLGTVDC